MPEGIISEMLERLFKLKQNKTDVKTEVIAGITTFMTMAYILAVNPSILSASGMDSTAVMLATCIASFIGRVCMGLMANLPFALSAGMGINAFMAYTVVLGYGYTWQTALLAVFIEGIIFIILSVTNVREAIFNSIPLSLKQGVSVGLGMFIAFIGMQNAGIVVGSSTLISITDFRNDFTTSGICALLAIIGTFITLRRISRVQSESCRRDIILFMRYWRNYDTNIAFLTVLWYDISGSHSTKERYAVCQ